MERHARFAACALAAAIACGSDREPADLPDFQAPLRASAALALEPDELRVGEVATVELLVAAPPSHRVAPVAPPEIEGVSLLDAVALAPEEGLGRQTHRTRFRIRAESVGSFVWPALDVAIEAEDGETYAVALPARPFEVRSVRDRFPDRDEPFGLEEIEPAPRATSPGFFGGLALGVLGTALAGLALFLARARRRSDAPPLPEAPGPPGLFDWSEREFAAAFAALAEDSRRAASSGSRLLRVYMARRFGSETEAATTEELSARTPALSEHGAWSDFVRLLRSFDDERFPPGEPGAARVRAALEGARALIEASRPAGATRP
jgi:hypothetical protein